MAKKEVAPVKEVVVEAEEVVQAVTQVEAKPASGKKEILDNGMVIQHS